MQTGLLSSADLSCLFLSVFQRTNTDLESTFMAHHLILKDDFQSFMLCMNCIRTCTGHRQHLLANVTYIVYFLI